MALEKKMSKKNVSLMIKVGYDRDEKVFTEWSLNDYCGPGIFENVVHR